MSTLQRNQNEPYLSAYLHNKGRRLGLPVSGTFELTARCNFHCPMCYVHLSQEDAEAAGRELTAREWIDLAREAKNQGMVFALLTGGEPFVRKDFFEIYSAMKQMGILVSINSNGSMLSGPVLEKLLENPPFRVNISLYGGSNETYRNMCGRDAYETVVENIRALREAGVDVRLNLSITPYNHQDIGKICDAARELGVHVKGSSYMYPSIRVNGQQYGEGNRLSPDEAAEAGLQWDLLRFTPEQFAQRAEAMHALHPLAPEDCPLEIDAGVRCRAGSSSFWMTWDGRMLPCGMMPHPVAYPLEVGFQTAWNQIREATRAIRTPSQCAVCPKRDVCGPCAAICITETGYFDQLPEYKCRMTDALIEKTWQAYCQGKEQHGD